jgi:protein-L-isoaspartate(D-aspartate) O-methyltransferase
MAIPAALPGQDRYAAARARMVREQIASRGVGAAAVLEAMRSVPRHEFVPVEQREQAYEDHPLPIGYGQTISQPYIVALMSELLEVTPEHRVLEIGCGSGYQAAVLSRLAKQVFTIELIPELARTARARLARLGYGNVTVRQGDGYRGWPEQAPFDRIMMTAAPEDVPAVLVQQLRPGGKLVGPTGGAGAQELIVLDKSADGKVRRRTAAPVRFVPMVPGRQ